MWIKIPNLWSLNVVKKQKKKVKKTHPNQLFFPSWKKENSAEGLIIWSGNWLTESLSKNSFKKKKKISQKFVKHQSKNKTLDCLIDVNSRRIFNRKTFPRVLIDNLRVDNCFSTFDIKFTIRLSWMFSKDYHIENIYIWWWNTTRKKKNKNCLYR